MSKLFFSSRVGDLVSPPTVTGGPSATMTTPTPHDRNTTHVEKSKEISSAPENANEV